MQILPHIIFSISICTAFILQDDLPGVIPNLSVGRPGMPGGKSAVDIHNPTQYDSIWHMLNYLVDEIQNEDLLNVSRRRNYTLHQAVVILEATSQVTNGLGYEIIFMVGEKSCDKSIGFYNDNRASNGTILASQQATTKRYGQNEELTQDSMSHDALPTNTGPKIFHCRVKSNNDGFGKCYIQFVKLLKDHAVHVKKNICVKVHNYEPFTE